MSNSNDHALGSQYTKQNLDKIYFLSKMSQNIPNKLEWECTNLPN